jgi:hypothetical protein
MRQVNLPPHIENDSEGPLRAEVTAVLNHMFNGYRRVVVGRRFKSGFSGAAVYLLRPIRPDGAELPTVVKIAPAHLIRQEWQAYQTCIRHRLANIAPIATEPVFAPDTTWGGLRYPLVGAGQFPTISLLDYCRQNDPADITYILAGRLFQSLRATWGQHTIQPEFALGHSYDHLLPVNLLLTAARQTATEGHLFTPANAVPSSWPAGTLLTLQGFRITEIDPGRRMLTLDLPLPVSNEGTPRSYRLRVQNISPWPDELYQVGQIADSLTARVLATKADLLRQQIQAALPDLDLAAKQVPLADGTMLPNPLTHLAAVLKQRFDVRVACIHGDLHLENVLVEYDHRSHIVQLIDFGQARPDHVLHDLLRLESSLILHLLPSLLAASGYPATMVHTLYQRLHEGVAGQRVRAAPPGLERIFTALLHIRQEAKSHLGASGNWAEYYQGLTLYLLGALKYGNLDEPVEDVAPKAIAFWGAATVQQVVQTGEIGMNNGTQINSIASSSLAAAGPRFWLADWLNQVTGWSDAPPHMRSSWAGMAIWLLDRLGSLINPQRVITGCVSLLLWLAALYLLLPLWHWTAVDLTERLIMMGQVAAAFLLLPPVMAWATRPDYDDLIIRETWRQRGRLYFLKWAGALAGLTTFVWLGTMVSLFWLWLGQTPLPAPLGWLLLAVAVLFSHIAARRIPADRYKMYGHKPTLHKADIFIASGLLVGSLAILLFVYLFYELLLWRGTAVLTIIAFILVALLERRQKKQASTGQDHT